MRSESSVEVGATISVERIGGIDEATVEFSPGVNILEGRNATNRTSLLQGIMAALGSDAVSLKGDADMGRVELSIGGETYTRTIERQRGTTTMSGDPYLNDPTLANLFAFLLESNEARRSIARGDDLREVIMRPVDTEDIERRIAEAEERREEIDDRITDLRERKRRLTDLESERSEISDDLSDQRAEREAVREELASLDAGVEELESQREAYTERLEELTDTRNELEDVEQRLKDQKDQRDALRDERAELQEERSALPTSFEEISQLGQRIGELQERRRTLGSLLDRLQNIIQFNDEVVDDADSELREVVSPDDVAADNGVTEQLLTDRELVCWTCGSTVNRSEIAGRLDDLREFRQEKMAERKEVSDELDGLRERKRETEKHQRRREQIEQKLQRIDDRIEQHSQRIEQLRERREKLRDELGELERDVESIEPEESDSRILDLNKRENELTLSVDSLESDLREVEAKIEEIEDAIAEIPRLEDERESVNEQLTNLRNRIDDLEAEAIAAFNRHMESLVDRLDYANIDRVWLERRETTVREGRQNVPKTEFDLHVVRTTDDGAAYEDTVDHLSESEREVTGLVLALAGYLVHDVYQEVPFMLLDSLEAIDSNRIATLVEYFAEYADFLVVALLPEDAQAVGEEYRHVTEI